MTSEADPREVVIGLAVDRLAKVLDCRVSEIRHWTDLLGSRIPGSGLTDHQIASIGAVVWLRQNTPPTKKQLERFFARLAFMTDPDSEWTVIRMPRKKEPQIVVGPSTTENLVRGSLAAAGTQCGVEGIKRPMALRSVPSFVPRNRSDGVLRNVPDWTATLKTQH